VTCSRYSLAVFYSAALQTRCALHSEYDVLATVQDPRYKLMPFNTTSAVSPALTPVKLVSILDTNNATTWAASLLTRDCLVFIRWPLHRFVHDNATLNINVYNNNNNNMLLEYLRTVKTTVTHAVLASAGPAVNTQVSVSYAYWEIVLNMWCNRNSSSSTTEHTNCWCTCTLHAVQCQII